MYEFRDLLVNVWREACRHTEITQSTRPSLAFWRANCRSNRSWYGEWTRTGRCVETVALGLQVPEGLLPEARTELSSAQMEGLLAWCGRDEVIHAGTGSPRPELLMILPARVRADVLAGPLALQHGRFGILVLVARAGEAFENRHADLLRVLVEPFSVALDNDQRLGEMAALREAAEADKRSLLIRLGRSNLGDTIVGAESGLRAVMERVELVARSDVPVLDLRRDRLRQGSGGTGHPQPFAAGRRTVHPRQLRGHSRTN